MLLRALRAAVQAGHHLIQRADMLDQLAGAGVQMGNKLIERAPARRFRRARPSAAARSGRHRPAPGCRLSRRCSTWLDTWRATYQAPPSPSSTVSASRPPSARPKRRESASIWSMRGQAVAAVLAQPAQRGLGDVQRGFQRLGMFGGARHVQLAGGHLFRHLVGLGKILGRGLAGLSHISRHAVGVLQSGQRLALLAVQGFASASARRRRRWWRRY